MPIANVGCTNTKQRNDFACLRRGEVWESCFRICGCDCTCACRTIEPLDGVETQLAPLSFSTLYAPIGPIFALTRSTRPGFAVGRRGYMD